MTASEHTQTTLGFGEFSRRFVARLWPWYVSGTVLLAAINLINLQIPQLAKEIINRLVAANDLSGERGNALAIIGLGILTIIIRSLSRVLIFWPGRQVETAIKSHLFARTMLLPETFYARFGMGDLISRLSNDVSQLRAFYAFGVLQVLNVAFLTVFTLAKMASVHATLTMLLLIPLTLTFVITRFAMPRMHKYSSSNQQAIGALTNRVTEAFVNVHVIQANAATATFVGRAAEKNQEVFQTAMKMVYIRTLIWPLMTCLAGVSQLVVLLYGGHEVIAGRLSVGDILAFNVYIGLLTFPLTAMGIILSLLQRARTALERISAIDRATPELQSSPHPEAPSASIKQDDKPMLEIRDLHFSYPGAASPALRGINLRLMAGQSLGLFGRIGSGKSTLFQVLTRLYDPPPATVFWRGKDILNIPPSELRRDIGLALQQVHLFSSTIRANLAFGITPEPPMAALIEAARQAQILAEIEAFDRGWDTEIGERGVRLSGGQKQRLALARVLLRMPPLLLLDDVLSAVDHTTERRLIDEFYQMKSSLIIASHRGSALVRCGEILILDDGEIVDRGTYQSLVKNHPELISAQ